MTNKVKKDKSKSGPWIIIITLISALAVSYYQWNRHTNQTESYNTVMKSYTPPTPRISTKPFSNKLQKAISLFEEKKYSESYDLFRAISPKTDDINWYLSHLALINGKVYEAKYHSNKISDSNQREEIRKYINKIIG